MLAAGLIGSTSLVAGASASIVHRETVTGAASGSTVSTSASVAAAPGDLYLLVVSSRPFQPIASVTGLGLAWTPVTDQCAGRNQGGVSVWRALGVPDGSGPVSATLSSSVNNAVIAVSRYSGADGVAPIVTAVSANTNGIDGGCSGGSDDDSYSFDVPIGLEGTMVYAAIAHRHFSHTPGEEFTERAAIERGSLGETVSVSVVDAAPASAATFSVTGDFRREVDWAAAAVVIRPFGQGPGLGVTTTGLGSVILGPPGGIYEDGERVALIANPIPGWRFDRWEGALTGSVNPDSVTVMAGVGVNAVFTKLPRHEVAVAAVGSGSVILSPPGGEYPEGATVTIAAQPVPGWRFQEWDGSIGGSSNPRQLVLQSAESVTATFVPAPVGDVAYEEVRTGSSSGSADVVTSGDLGDGAGDLYLAAISTRPIGSVTSVSGLGLAWMPVEEQCAGRSQAGIEVWKAHGATSGAGPVAASLAQSAEHAAIAVVRYSGVDLADPVGAVVSANTNGVGGACSGGDDNGSYSFDLEVGPGAIVFGALAHRHRLHSEGPDFTERAEIHEGTLGNTVSVSVVDRKVEVPGDVTVSGSFSGAVDWAGIAVEVRPGAGSSSGPVLQTTTSGLGTVLVDPPASLHADGTVVTLTAVPYGGWEFDGWFDGLSGTENPETLTLSGDIEVGAHFRRSDLVTLHRHPVGSGNVIFDPPGERYSPGTPVTVTAVPHPDWAFDGWGGAAIGGGNPKTVTATEDADIVGSFRYVGETSQGLWSSPAELVGRPLSGESYEALLAAADAPFNPPHLDRTSSDNVECLAAAIVYSRTNIASYRNRVVEACSTLAATGYPGDETLAWAREVGAYALAADLVGYRTPELEDWFENVAETWVAEDGRTVLEVFRERPNNWGMHAFGMLAAVYGYLGDSTRLNAIREDWVRGVRGPDPGYKWGDQSWHADPANPRLVNPVGSTKGGVNLDGALPDDLRRGGPFSNPPLETGYPWGAMQGMVMAARVFERYDPYLSIWHVGDDAIRRAANLLHVVWEGEYGGWAAEGDDMWLLRFLDDAYLTNWSTGDRDEWGAGKNAGWAYVLLPASQETGAPLTIAPSVGGRLHRNFPNPFGPSTTVRYSLTLPGRVELTVYDIAGRLVATLLDDVRAPGTHTVRWAGVDSQGRPVASGVYWVNLRIGSHQEAVKLTVVR